MTALAYRGAKLYGCMFHILGPSKEDSQESSGICPWNIIKQMAEK